MTSLYEVLKRSKTAPQLAPDMFTALWAKSITAGKTIEMSGQVPLSFKANGAPLIDYTISGNMEQSGTPTPDSPIMPQGTGETTGNLFDYKTAYAQYLSGDDIVITPTQMASEKQYFKASEVGKTVTISVFAKTVTSNRVYIRASIGGTNVNSNTVSRGNSGTLTVTVTPTSTSDFFNLTYGDGGDYNTFNKFMVNEGSTALPYEPYGYKIPISSAETTTPIYLGEVQTTRKIRKLVLTGQESWDVNSSSNVFFAPINNALGTANVKTSVCSHYQAVDNKALYRLLDNYCSCIRANASALWIKDTNYTAKEDFKSYLAAQYANGSPVTVFYVLATETTGIVNEPLMKISTYADTVSKAQAGVTIPTNNGSTTVDVDTTLKPSEVYIKYHTR